MPAPGELVTGNAAEDTVPFRGWLVGHFVPPEFGLRSTPEVEVKWGVHPVGDSRSGWGSNEATTFSVLVSGSIRYEFSDGQCVRLVRPGDYALWAPGVPHRWFVEREPTVVFTVRWPSIAP
ncbi:MAG: signal peptidase I [Chloroflexi bacterium]|nr:signal peptidase I [Chloroflexota bacterium]MBV9895700.1 signal peptidase I [Chloroflexota bacterium]